MRENIIRYYKIRERKRRKWKRGKIKVRTRMPKTMTMILKIKRIVMSKNLKMMTMKNLISTSSRMTIRTSKESGKYANTIKK